MNNFLDAALGYRAKGCAVLAVRENKAPYREGWNRWFQEPQTEQELREEFSNGGYGLALLMWPASPYVCLDFDGPHADEAWQSTGIELPDTTKNTTPSAGRHRIFRMPAGEAPEIKRQVRLVKAQCGCEKDGKPKPCGVDLLVRGYAVGPPTPGYREDPDHPLEDAVPLPLEIIELAKKHQEKKQLVPSSNAGGKIPQGERNSTLVSRAGTMRACGMSVESIRAALHAENKRQCEPPLDDREIENIIKSAAEWPKGAQENHNPWAHAKDAPSFLAEEEKEFEGLAKDIVAPGAITLIASPRGDGKTLVLHALAVALATGGVFRGEKVSPARVLVVDRDNPKAIIKKRLRSWGAMQAPELHVLTRENAPSLRDKNVWRAFPVKKYDVVMIDSVGSTTEGITEKEGKETTEVLGTILDLARQGLAVVLLQNTTKDAVNIRGRGEWMDRTDIIYEVRDATGFVPLGKKTWWQELPEAGESTWAERAARRKGRITYRLAFIPSKYRIGAEPEPFCLEVHLPENESWTLSDVTFELLQAGEEAMAQARRKEEERLEKSAHILADVIGERTAEGKLMLKTEAESFLKESGLTREEARSLINGKNGILWRIESIPGKGNPKVLFPLSNDASNTDSAAKMQDSGEAYQKRTSEGGISADQAQSGRQKWDTRNPASEATLRGPLFSPPDGSNKKAAGPGGVKSPPWEEEL